MGEESGQQQRLGRAMFWLMWLLVLGLLSMGFNVWLTRATNPNPSPTSVVGADGVREIELRRNRWGHYVATGSINGRPVVFIVDTGASDISIPAGVADRLGLKRGPPVTYSTANGPATGYLTSLQSVALGGLELRNVRASINPNVDGDEVLLGMSFLKHLDFRQQGDRLILRRPAAGSR